MAWLTAWTAGSSVSCSTPSPASVGADCSYRCSSHRIRRYVSPVMTVLGACDDRATSAAVDHHQLQRLHAAPPPVGRHHRIGELNTVVSWFRALFPRCRVHGNDGCAVRTRHCPPRNPYVDSAPTDPRNPPKGPTEPRNPPKGGSGISPRPACRHCCGCEHR